MSSPERKGDVSTERKSNDDRALDLEGVENRGDVVGVAIDRERRSEPRVSETAKVDRNASTLGDERADLRFPHGAIERKRVQEDHRESGAHVVVRDRGVVDERDHSGSGHCGSISRQLSGTGTGWPS